MDSRRTSSASDTSSSNRRSALSAPTASRPILMGTQMNDMSFFRKPLRAPVRLRKRGSSEMRGTTAGSPLCTTCPVTPSPRRYLPRSCWLRLRPWAASMKSSPVSRLSRVIVPRTMPMCSDIASSTGSTTSRRSMLRPSAWLTSKSSDSSLTSRWTLGSVAAGGTASLAVELWADRLWVQRDLPDCRERRPGSQEHLRCAAESLHSGAYG